ncbi:hypothetical protein [Sphingomonas montanisoli]|uniref:hypothetical protein n=1 Tax=Sphingomonas montanisoli TaxID=2606412 RepID=UPI0011F14A63|nr:hypothetical protein [Sphingomonas montanisoli]
MIANIGIAVSASNAASPSLQDPAIGSHWPAESSFATPPVRAKPVPGSACDVADRYVTLQGAGRQDEITALFAPTASLLGISETVVRGRDQLTAHFSHAISRKVIPISFVDRGRECFMELASPRLGDDDGPYRLAAIDHFVLDQNNQIERLVIYIKPGIASAATGK